MHLFGWGENEPIIAPASDGGDRTNVFAVKVKALFASLFDDLNAAFDDIEDGYLPLTGGTLTGDLKTRSVNPSLGSSFDIGTCAKPYKTVHATEYHVDDGAGGTRYSMTDDGIMPTTGGGFDIGSASVPIGSLYAQNVQGGEGQFTKITVTSGLSGNAATASKLANKVNINGTAFDGSGSITTANWGTARNVYIQDASGAHTGVAVSVNGSAAVNLRLPSSITATLEGNASSATKLATQRTISLSGAVTADPVYFNGTANANINVKTLDASKLVGKLPSGVVNQSVSATVIKAGVVRSISNRDDKRKPGQYIVVTGNGTASSPYTIGIDNVYDYWADSGNDDGGDPWDGYDGTNGDDY